MIFQNAMVWNNNRFIHTDVRFDDVGFVYSVFSDKVTELSSDRPSASSAEANDISASSDFLIIPGFCDVHVHLREPGFSYKETVRTGTKAAAAGGYTSICTMPNLCPVPDSVESLKCQTELIKRDALINVYPYGALTVGEMGVIPSDMEDIADKVVAFSDDGRGVQSESLMRELMTRARKLGKIVAAHCEDNSLLRNGYIHDGVYAKKHGHRGICSESEWRQIERDIKLAEETGCPYHVCHISSKESVELIRQAKKRGVDISCETAPHYLVFSDKDLKEEGRFKMNPPLRDESDRYALLEGLCDGTIDMIATDHAPHSAEEKSRGLEKSLFGIVGLETAFPVLYTYLVKGGVIDLEKLVCLMCINPRERFGITDDMGYCIRDLGSEYTVDPSEFCSMGRATPWEGVKLYGKNLITVLNGKVIFENN